MKMEKTKTIVRKNNFKRSAFAKKIAATDKGIDCCKSVFYDNRCFSTLFCAKGRKTYPE